MAAPKQTSPNAASQATETKTAEEVKPSVEPVVLSKPPPPDVKDPPPSSEEVATKDAPTASPPVAAAATFVPQPELTYAGTESSDAYLLAKRLLNDGDFDNALETIAKAMANVASHLPADDEASLHESMAPFYYLYGTTLLYSIEESSDNLQAPQVNPEEEEEADDSQIAWENLETARHILHRIAGKSSEDKLQLDLAQIHLRLGDLQRFNGRYKEAIDDYQACLEIRQPILGKYHRKVAELHHIMGLAYMSLAAEGDKQQEQQPLPEGIPAEAVAPPLTPEQIEGFRSKSIQHYVACGRSFAGQIAFLCGADPKVITADASDTEQGGKTTGMGAEEVTFFSSSRTIQAIRDRVAKLQPPPAEQDTVADFKELLDEIQETIDEVEATKQGIKEVSEMKAKANAAIAGEETTNLDGSTTSIGFGNTTTTTTTTASAPAAAAAPMMVVRKKKKRDEEDSKMPAQEDPSKRAKTE